MKSLKFRHSCVFHYFSYNKSRVKLRTETDRHRRPGVVSFHWGFGLPVSISIHWFNTFNRLVNTKHKLAQGYNITPFLLFSAKCPPGQYSDTGLAPCFPCPVNFYQPLSGQSQCLQCPTNTRTKSTGAAGREECQAIQCTENSCQHGGLCVPIGKYTGNSEERYKGKKLNCFKLILLMALVKTFLFD